MSSKELNNIRELLEYDDISLELFFVQRKSKTAQKKKSFNYTISKLDTSREVNDFFKKSVKTQVSRFLDLGTSLQNYAVISDDMPNSLYIYKDASKLKLSGQIWEKMLDGTAITSATSLGQIKKNIWFYCVKATVSIDGEIKSVIFFKKITQASVATDEPQNFLHKMKASLDSSDPKLVPVKPQHITFEDKFDCALINDSFIIFSKSYFEKIVELEDEFIEQTNTTLAVIEAQGVIQGIEILKSEITSKPSLMRTLVNITRNENHSTIGAAEIAKMKQMLLDFDGQQLKTTPDGKILIENKDDSATLLKLLNDYYKQGLVTGKTYGSNSGNILQRKSS
ncbi:Kiwa anti-phage protein KwaB-like domain-containing protein [Pseudomonas monteilii]